MDQSFGWGAAVTAAIGLLVRLVPSALAYLERRASARETAARQRARLAEVRRLVDKGATAAEAAAAVNAVSAETAETTNGGDGGPAGAKT